MPNQPNNQQKPKLSHMYIGGLYKGRSAELMSRALLRTKGVTLRQYVDGLHGWVKKNDKRNS